MSRKLINCKTCKAEIAKSAKVCPNCGARNKKPFFMKWWVWAFAAVVIVIAVMINSGGGNTAAPAASKSTSQTTTELINLLSMNKADVVKTMGKPTTVGYDDNTGYNYIYEMDKYMFMVMGNAEGVTDINMTANVQDLKLNQFSVYGVKLGDSFDKVLSDESKFGTIESYQAVPNGNKQVVYMTKEGYSVSFGTEMESDMIKSIMFAKDGGLGDAVD